MAQATEQAKNGRQLEYQEGKGCVYLTVNKNYQWFQWNSQALKRMTWMNCPPTPVIQQEEEGKILHTLTMDLKMKNWIVFFVEECSSTQTFQNFLLFTLLCLTNKHSSACWFTNRIWCNHVHLSGAPIKQLLLCFLSINLCVADNKRSPQIVNRLHRSGVVTWTSGVVALT